MCVQGCLVSGCKYGYECNRSSTECEPTVGAGSTPARRQPASACGPCCPAAVLELHMAAAVPEKPSCAATAVRCRAAWRLDVTLALSATSRRWNAYRRGASAATLLLHACWRSSHAPPPERHEHGVLSPQPRPCRFPPFAQLPSPPPSPSPTPVTIPKAPSFAIAQAPDLPCVDNDPEENCQYWAKAGECTSK